jgi:hypothetical protein
MAALPGTDRPDDPAHDAAPGPVTGDDEPDALPAAAAAVPGRRAASTGDSAR